jgi:hypothetical protein
MIILVSRCIFHSFIDSRRNRSCWLASRFTGGVGGGERQCIRRHVFPDHFRLPFPLSMTSSDSPIFCFKYKLLCVLVVIQNSLRNLS